MHKLHVANKIITNTLLSGCGLPVAAALFHRSGMGKLAIGNTQCMQVSPRQHVGSLLIEWLQR